jgi:hypothetical protein
MPWKAANSHVSITLENPNIASAYLLDANGYKTQELFVDKSGGNNSRKIDLPRNAMYVVLNDVPATINEPNVVTDLEEDLEGSIRIYPNPTDGNIHLQLPESASRFDRLEIFDLQGKLVKRFDKLDQPILFQGKKGYYLIKLLRDGNEVTRQKILVN